MQSYDLSVHTPVDVDVTDDVDDAIPVMGSDAHEEVLLSKYASEFMCMYAGSAETNVHDTCMQCCCRLIKTGVDQAKFRADRFRCDFHR